MPHILVVEDEPAIADAVLFSLQAEGWSTHWSPLLSDAKSQWQQADLLVLDVGLPDGSGFEFCRELRKHSDVPVLFLTARSDEIDRVVGLELGADDYISKPFSPRELVARVRANLKRWQRPADQPAAPPSVVAPQNAAATQSAAAQMNTPASMNTAAPLNTAASVSSVQLSHSQPTPVHTSLNPAQAVTAPAGLTLGDFILQSASCRIWLCGQLLELTALEYRLLAHFLAHPHLVHSRESLLIACGQTSSSAYERNMDTHIKSVRAKCKHLSPRSYIQTVRGFGYRFEPMGVDEPAGLPQGPQHD